VRAVEPPEKAVVVLQAVPPVPEQLADEQDREDADRGVPRDIM